MWIGIITVIAFFAGFCLAAMLACAKAADTEMEKMRIAAFSRNSHRWHIKGSVFRRRFINAPKTGQLLGRNLDKADIQLSRLRELNNDRGSKRHDRIVRQKCYAPVVRDRSHVHRRSCRHSDAHNAARFVIINRNTSSWTRPQAREKHARRA